MVSINAHIEQNRLEKIINQAMNNAKGAYSKFQATEESAIFSEKSYEIDAMKFSQGKISVLELNTSKINHTKAQAELIKAKYGLLFRTALIDFYQGKSFSF